MEDMIAAAHGPAAGLAIRHGVPRAERPPWRALCTAAIDTRTIRKVKAEPGEPAASLPEAA
jgi:hypothetical protein